VFARSDDSDIGYYTRKLAGLDAAEMLHDEVADVFVVALDAPEGA
jgi:plasmid stabilization system protein ParE